MTEFRAIVADPPWVTKAGRPLGAEFFGDGGSRAPRPLPYATMTVDAICALPVAALAARDCHLYLWATNGYLPSALRVLDAWGFRYSACLTWCKSLMGGGLGGTFRLNTEFCLFATRGRVDARDVVRGSHFGWKRPYDERGKPRHSAKPPEFFDLVERVSHGPRLELFAREVRPGWERWGNEVASTVALPNGNDDGRIDDGRE